MAASNEPAYRDPNTLRRLYHEENLSQSDIADRFGCCRKTITNWMQKHEIETNPGEKLAAKRTGEQNPAWNRETRECNYCGDEVERAASTFNGKKAYCDSDCFTGWKREEDERKPPSNEIDEEILIQDLQDLAEELGRPPSTRDINQHSNHGHPTYRSKFGGMAEARERAGLQKHIPFGKEGLRMYEDARHPYGDRWEKARNKRLERDGYQCVICGKSNQSHIDEFNKGLNVHHIIPARKFDNLEKADEIDNLLTLCSVHHREWEGVPLRPDVRPCSGQ